MYVPGSPSSHSASTPFHDEECSDRPILPSLVPKNKPDGLPDIAAFSQSSLTACRQSGLIRSPAGCDSQAEPLLSQMTHSHLRMHGGELMQPAQAMVGAEWMLQPRMVLLPRAAMPGAAGTMLLLPAAGETFHVPLTAAADLRRQLLAEAGPRVASGAPGTAWICLL